MEFDFNHPLSLALSLSLATLLRICFPIASMLAAVTPIRYSCASPPFAALANIGVKTAVRFGHPSAYNIDN